jgi:hypothetical protein
MLSGRSASTFKSAFAWNACHSLPRTVPEIFFHSIREIFVCSLRKTFGHLSDRAKKIEIDNALTLEHYTDNKVFVSREAEPELLADASVVRAEPDHVPIIFLRQIPGVEDRHPARSHKDPAWFPQLPRKNRYRPPGR